MQVKKYSGKAIPLSGIAGKFIKFLDGVVTPKSLLCLLVTVYIASLIPLLWIGCYNYPAADDYTFGAACRNVWVETHSVIAVLARALLRAWEYYQNWAGCMSSSFFMALQPGVFGEGFYKVTSFLMIGIISLSTLYLMHVIFVKLFGCNPCLIHSISMLMLFVMIQCMPDSAEGLFWYNGAMHYTFMHGISLFFYGVLISAVLEENHRKKRLSFIISAFLGLIAGMGNYMTALNVGIVLALALIGLIIGKKFKGQQLIMIPSIVFYLSFIINMTAPGNAARAAVSGGMNPIKAVFASFYYVLDYCLGAWSGWVTLVFAIITAMLFWNASKGVDFDFPCPLFVAFMNYCILSAMVTPPLFGAGNIEAGRIKSLIYMMYILLLAFTVCYVTGWAQKRLGAEAVLGKKDAEAAGMVKASQLSLNSKIAVSGCIVFLLIGSALCLVPNPEYYTFSVAAADILNGNAAAYGAAMQERADIYNASAGMDVEVGPLPAKPKLLCTSDISADSEDWVNLGVCRFYGLNSVRVDISKGQ